MEAAIERERKTMQVRWRQAAMVAALLLAAVTSSAAAARPGAPEYVSSEPADGAKLHEPPDEVSVTFSEPLDPGSTLVVLDECGKNVDNGEVEVFATEMTVGLERGPSGRYVAKYVARGLAGVTGTTAGKFDFTVHMGKSCAGVAGHHHGTNRGEHMNHGRSSRGHQGAHQGSPTHGTHPATGHTMGSGEAHSGHTAARTSHGGNGHAEQKHGNHRPGQHRADSRQPGDPGPPLAVGTDPAAASFEDAGQALLVGFALVLAIGALGGWLVRSAI